MPENIFEYIWLAGWVVYFFGVYTPHMRQFRAVKRTNLNSTPLDILLDFLAFGGWQVIPLIYIFSHWLDFVGYRLPTWTGWIGAVLLAFSVWLFWRAYQDLGRNWSPRIEVMEGQSLVTDGVYAHIRHPVYAAMWLWSFAQPLLLHNWVAGFGLLVVFIPLYLLRVPREEQMMLEHFGEDYHVYMIRTGRILPYLWKN